MCGLFSKVEFGGREEVAEGLLELELGFQARNGLRSGGGWVEWVVVGVEEGRVNIDKHFIIRWGLMGMGNRNNLLE